jgi:hypothetical protein
MDRQVRVSAVGPPVGQGTPMTLQQLPLPFRGQGRQEGSLIALLVNGLSSFSKSFISIKRFVWVILWVPNIVSPHATCEYSCSRPPSRPLRVTVMSASMGSGSARNGAGAENSSVQVAALSGDHAIRVWRSRGHTGNGMMIYRAAAPGLPGRHEHLLVHVAPTDGRS